MAGPADLARPTPCGDWTLHTANEFNEEALADMIAAIEAGLAAGELIVGYRSAVTRQS